MVANKASLSLQNLILFNYDDGDDNNNNILYFLYSRHWDRHFAHIFSLNLPPDFMKYVL